MEERGPPAAADEDTNEDPPLSETQIVPVPPPPPFEDRETYVIQIPKEQIYRVPPPENALIVERRGNPEKKKKSSCCGSRCLVIGAILFFGCLIIGITLLALSLALKPQEPTFSVTHVHVKNPKSKFSSSKDSYPGYEVSLKVKNPNGHDITYANSEGASLLFKEKTIGKGKFPLKNQRGQNSAAVKLVLDGSNGKLPRDVEKSMKDTDSKVRVSLALNMDLSVKMKRFIKTWNMETAVKCHVKVSTLGKGTRVLQQKCESKFKG